MFLRRSWLFFSSALGSSVFGRWSAGVLPGGPEGTVGQSVHEALIRGGKDRFCCWICDGLFRCLFLGSSVAYPLAWQCATSMRMDGAWWLSLAAWLIGFLHDFLAVFGCCQLRRQTLVSRWLPSGEKVKHFFPPVLFFADLATIFSQSTCVADGPCSPRCFVSLGDFSAGIFACVTSSFS